MIDALVLWRILLAGVFVVAGLAKAMNPKRTRRAFIDLGGPPSVAGIAAVALPVLEITTAMALLFRATAWLASGFTVLLLALFTLVLLAQFRKEIRPACPCFGFSRPKPVGRSEVARNLVLAGLAGGIVVAGPSAVGPDVGAWLLAAHRTALFGAIALAAAIGAVALVVRRRERAVLAGRESSVLDEVSGAGGAQRVQLAPVHGRIPDVHRRHGLLG